MHVSEIGAPHLIDPSRLEASARRLYGDAFDELWGELAPVPAENVHVVGDEVVGLACFPTPGHAWHHVSYLDGAGTLYAGDAAGVRVGAGAFVMPPCPPPEFDLEAWEHTILEIERRAPDRLALIHFGVHDDVEEHLAELRETLESLGRVGRERHGRADLRRRRSPRRLADGLGAGRPYDRAAPYRHHFRGIERYWRKRREALRRARPPDVALRVGQSRPTKPTRRFVGSVSP